MKEVFVLMHEQLTMSHVKGHRLSDIERGSIAQLHQQGFSNRQIAARIGVCPQTVNNELHRGKIDQVKKVNGHRQYYHVYDPYASSARYLHNRNCHRPRKITQAADFWLTLSSGLSVIIGLLMPLLGGARREHFYQPNKKVCMATLFNYIDAQLLEIRNINLLEKTKRRTGHKHLTKHKRLIGRST